MRTLTALSGNEQRISVSSKRQEEGQWTGCVLCGACFRQLGEAWGGVVVQPIVAQHLDMSRTPRSPCALG